MSLKSSSDKVVCCFKGFEKYGKIYDQTDLQHVFDIKILLCKNLSMLCSTSFKKNV